MRNYDITDFHSALIQKTQEKKVFFQPYHLLILKPKVNVLTPENIMPFLEIASDNMYHNLTPINLQNFLACVEFLYDNNFAGMNVIRTLNILLKKIDINGKLTQLAADYCIKTNFAEISSGECLRILISESEVNYRHYPLIKACIKHCIDNEFPDFHLFTCLNAAINQSHYYRDELFDLCLKYMDQKEHIYHELLTILKALNYQNAQQEKIDSLLCFINDKYKSLLLEPDLRYISAIHTFIVECELTWSKDIILEMMKYFRIDDNTLKSALFKVHKYIDVPVEDLHAASHNLNIFCKLSSIIYKAEEYDSNNTALFKIVDDYAKRSIQDLAWKIFTTDKKLFEDLKMPLIDVWRVFEKYLSDEQIATIEHAEVSEDNSSVDTTARATVYPEDLMQKNDFESLSADSRIVDSCNMSHLSRNSSMIELGNSEKDTDKNSHIEDYLSGFEEFWKAQDSQINIQANGFIGSELNINNEN